MNTNKIIDKLLTEENTDAVESKGLKILMVEDLPSDCELIKYEISKSGIRFIDQVVESEEAYIKAQEFEVKNSLNAMKDIYNKYL